MALFGWRKSRACKHEDKRVSKLGAADKTSPAVNSKCSSNGCTRYSSGRDSHTQVAPAVATSVHPSSIIHLFCSSITGPDTDKQPSNLTLFGLNVQVCAQWEGPQEQGGNQTYNFLSSQPPPPGRRRGRRSLCRAVRSLMIPKRTFSLEAHLHTFRSLAGLHFSPIP